MKYRLKEKPLNMKAFNVLADYLMKLGIEKIESFIRKPDTTDEISPINLNNIRECIEELHYAFENNKKIFLQVDSDVDGITSASIFYNYFKYYYPNCNITYRLHEGKQHGVILDTIPEDAEYIIIPDAGTMQIKEQQELSKQGKKIIILDHHEVEEKIEDKNIILVNNQNSENFENKWLSGAGVVFKCIQLFDNIYKAGNNKYKDFYDLAALGILSDVMDSRTLDNNYIIYNGLKNINNKMFKALLKKQEYHLSSVDNPNKIDIVWYIAPVINAIIRAGTPIEKEELFVGFIESPKKSKIVSEIKGNLIEENYYEYVARNSLKVRSRQNSQKIKAVEFLKSKIEKEGFDKNKIIIAIASKKDAVVIPRNLSGLIAMELVKIYNKPALMLFETTDENNEIKFSGSGRAQVVLNFPSFLQYMRDSDSYDFAQGHAFAFGCSIKGKDLDKFIEECNKKLENVEFNESCYAVDLIIKDESIDTRRLFPLAKCQHIYGNGIPEVLIAIEGIVVPQDVMLMGANKNSVKINMSNISCVKFKDSDLAEKLTNFSSAKVKLVGKLKINEYMGYESLQLFIEDIEVDKKEKKELF